MTKPREWWIDDVTQRVCAPWDHPELGAETLPWPDNEKVIRAIDYEAYAAQKAALAEAVGALRKYVLDTKIAVVDGQPVNTWPAREALAKIEKLRGECSDASCAKCKTGEPCR